MDSRISPLAVVGMQAGDAKILRNAGARVTDDVLRTLVLASYLLGVNRVLVMPHTDCRMASADEATIHATIQDQFGVDTRSLEFPISVPHLQLTSHAFEHTPYCKKVFRLLVPYITYLQANLSPSIAK